MFYLSAVLMNKEQESQAVSQSTGPSESEVALQETISSLQQERDSLGLQYQAQVTFTHDFIVKYERDHVPHVTCAFNRRRVSRRCETMSSSVDWCRNGRSGWRSWRDRQNAPLRTRRIDCAF